MSNDTKQWILGHPRLLYLAILPAMVAGFAIGFSFAGSLGAKIGGPIGLWLALYGYALFRMHLLRTSGGSPPPEPPTEGAPRPAPLRPFSPLILSARAELPNERNA